MVELGNYEAQEELLQALQNDEELSRLAVGGYHNLVADKDAEFPRVVYTQLNDLPTGFADNKETKATVNFQISIFNISQTIDYEKNMYKAVDRIMKSLGYGRYDFQPLYEKDTKIYHLALRYKKNFY